MFTLPTNEELLIEIKSCRNSGQMSEELGNMFFQICDQFINLKKFEHFTDEWKKPRQEYALDSLQRMWQHFDPEKSSNPMGYFRCCVGCAIAAFRKKEMQV